MTKSIKLSTILSSGKLWEKAGRSRIYFESHKIAAIIGFEVEFYKSGNVSRASFDGEKISNGAMRSVLSALSGAYFDNISKAFTSDFLSVLAKYDIEVIDDVNVEEEAEEAEDVEAEEAADSAEAVEEAEEEAPAKTHGGRREGAGRKPTGHVQARFQLLPEQVELVRSLGGSAFLRDLLDEVKAGRIKLKSAK